MLINEKIDIPKYEGHLKSTLESLEKGIFELPDQPGGILGQEWWQFKIGNEVVGYGWIHEVTASSNQILEISFVVIKEYRKYRISVGRHIVEHLEIVCKDKGATCVQAIVKTTNPYSQSVIRLLCSLGYGSTPSYQSIDELIKYSKDLANITGINILMQKVF